MAKRKVSKRDLLIEQCLHDAYCEREGIINEGWYDDLKAGLGSKMASLGQRAENVVRGGSGLEKSERTHAAKSSAKIRSYANGLAQTMFDFKRSGGTLGRNIRNIDDVIHRLDLVSKGKVPDGPANDEPVSNQPSPVAAPNNNKNGVESDTKTSNSTPEEKSSLPSRSGYYSAGGSAPVSTPSQVLKKIKKPKTAKKLATTNNQAKPLKPLIPDKPLISLKPGKSPDETISPAAQPAEDGQAQPPTTPAPAPSEVTPETPTDEKIPAPVSGDAPEEVAPVDNPVSKSTDAIEAPATDKPDEVAKPEGQSAEQVDTPKGELVQKQTNPAKFGKFKDYFDFVNNGSQPYGRNISQSLGSGNYNPGKNADFKLTQVGQPNATPGIRNAKAKVTDTNEDDANNIIDAEIVGDESKLALPNREKPESANTLKALPPPADAPGNNTSGQNKMLDTIKFSKLPQSEREDPLRGVPTNFKVMSPRELRHKTDHAEGPKRRQVKIDRNLRNNQKSAEKSKEVQGQKTGNKSKPRGKRGSNGKKKSKSKKK